MTSFLNKNRIMGINLQYGGVRNVVLNAYMNCDYGDVESLIGYKSRLVELSSFCSEQSYDVIG